MKISLPSIAILVASISLGGGGGYIAKTRLANTPLASAAHQGESSDTLHSASEHSSKPNGESAELNHARDHESKKKKKSDGDGHGGGGHGAGPAGGALMKFSRQFVVPVFDEERPAYMMILDINLAGASDDAYQYEPQLRDAFLAEMLILSREGVLLGATREAQAMETLKQRLLARGRAILGEDISEVLILDLGVQPY